MVVEKLSIDIPVVVDMIRMHREFPMVRCNYLSIECDSPVTGLSINIGSEELPLLILGLAGIITRPLDAGRFSNVGLIEGLYRRIEDEEGLLIDIDDLWLPLFLFEGSSSRPEIGYVYRLNKDLFVLAFSFREGNLNIETYIEECRRMERALTFSEDEMGAFTAWREMQIKNAIDQYPKDSKLRLKYRDEDISE